MEIRKGEHGHRQFVLGPVEVGIASAIPAVLLMLLVFLGTTFTGQLGEQGKAITELAKEQAVTNAQLLTLSQQLADVPALTRAQAELRVRVDRHDEDLRELRQMRGLK